MSLYWAEAYENGLIAYLYKAEEIPGNSPLPDKNLLLSKPNLPAHHI